MWPDSTLREVAEALRLVVAPALASTSMAAQHSKLDVSVVCVSQQEGAVRPLIQHVSQEGRRRGRQAACQSLPL